MKSKINEFEERLNKLMQEDVPQMKQDIAIIKERVHSIKADVSNHLTDTIKIEDKYASRLKEDEDRIGDLEKWRSELRGQMIVWGALAALAGSVLGSVLIGMLRGSP